MYSETPDEPIVVSLTQQLSWTHFVALLLLKHPLECAYYAEMCRIERWSVSTLRVLDFLGLPDGYSARDLESAILPGMERFLQAQLHKAVQLAHERVANAQISTS